MDEKTLDIVLDVKVKVTVQLGSCQLPMREVLELSPGSVLQLNQHASDPVGLYVNEKLVAYGEVVVVEDNFGIKITELVGSVKLEDFTFATSSAYNLLYAAIRPLRINHELLSIRPPQKSSVFEFYTLPKLVIKNLFNWRQCQWHAFHAMIFNPP